MTSIHKLSGNHARAVMFNHRRLSLARKRRRLTAKGLAAQAGVSPLTIARLEKGENQPDDETIRKIADVLAYPVKFFYGEELDTINASSVSFRALSKMTAKQRDAALSSGSLGLMLFDWVEERFSLPEPNLLDLKYETDPEGAAQALRQHWNLGEKPVGSMIRLLEANGVRVLSLSEDTAAVDAFSFWRGCTPYVFLNTFKTAERSIMDAAHELGHLVLHAHGGVHGSRQVEREANSFASAFLMPRGDVRSRVPRFIKSETILKAKRRWRVSAMAMTYRLHTLQLISDWQYKSLCMELARRGYRSGEPDGIEREVSAVWKKVLSHLWAERTTKDDIADALGVPLDEIEGLIYGLAAAIAKPERERQANLRIVE